MTGTSFRSHKLSRDESSRRAEEGDDRIGHALDGTDAAGGNFIKEFVYLISLQSKHLFGISDRTRCKGLGPNTVRSLFYRNDS